MRPDVFSEGRVNIAAIRMAKQIFINTDDGVTMVFTILIIMIINRNRQQYAMM